MVKSMTLDFTNFKVLLHDFADLVSDKYYEKMNYHIWREMFTSRPGNTTVFIEWDNQAVDITLEEEPEWHHFVFGDNSFGDFIWENLLKDQECKVWENSKEGIQCTSSNAYDLALDIVSKKSDENVLINCGEQIEAMGIATKVSIKEDISSVATIATNASIKEDISSVAAIINTKVDKTEFDNAVKELTEGLLEIKNNCNDVNKKENSIMKNFKFDFGPANPNIVRMSMYGLAVKNKTGVWVSYNSSNDEIVDVDILNFEGSQFIWKMPVAIKDIVVGDIVVHQGLPMFVVNIPKDNKVLTVVDPVAGERKDIMLARSPFGFDFVIKVVNLLGNMFNNSASSDNPFGNMWMLMAMQGENGSFDMNMLMPMMMMNQGANADPTMMMICMAMTQNEDTSFMLPLLLTMQSMGNKTSSNHCQCNESCCNKEH